MDKALVIDFHKRLLLLRYFNFFFNNSLDRFIARTDNLIDLFFLFRNYFDRFLFNNSRGLNLDLNLRYRFFNFHF
jgi:hypothetical protein